MPIEPAPRTAGDDSPLGDTEVHHATSRHVDEVFKIFVGHCGTQRAGRPCALLCVTDGNGFFGAAVDMVRSMQLKDHLPALLVVGIGYRVGTLAETVPMRTRDLSPTRSESYSAIFPDEPVTGGADRFLAFLRDELLPWTHDHYPVDPGLTAYFGHSLGGLFGTYALLTAPDTFSRYVIGSPSLWWGDDDIFHLEQAYADTHDDLAARVFMGIGAHEDQAGRERESVRLSDVEQAIPASRSRKCSPTSSTSRCRFSP